MKKVGTRLTAAAVIALSSLALGSAEEVPYIPIQISFTPMVAVPFGYGDVGLELGAIGALTRDVDGAAASGVFTISRSIHGIQADGVFGVASGEVQGLQYSGVFNVAGEDVGGAQLAGVFNVAGGRVDGAQLAGVFNVAGAYRGPIQAAGVFNITSRIEGAQLSGVLNVADDARGAQIASIVNVADRMDGLQVGLINVADNLRGLQIGLINIARNGISGTGFVFDPVADYAWLYWQNGTPSFFPRLSAGEPMGNSWGDPYGLVASAGVGSRGYFGPRYMRSSWLDLDVGAAWYLGPAAVTLRDEMRVLRSEVGSDCMMDDPRFGQAFADAASVLPSRPWPVVSLTLGVPILWRLEAVVGVRSDIDFASWPAMPEAFRSGMDSGRLSIFGEDFHAYSKWYFGFRL